MNYTRVALASAGAFIAYMAVGFVAFGTLPFLRGEFLKYPAVYRAQEGQMSHFPAGMAGMLLSMVALTVLYAKLARSGGGATAGLEFGVWIGLFAVGAFVLHNYVNLNIGLRLTVFSAVAYFLEWCIVGITIGLIYKD